ncbi:uncharacterized protein TNCT_508051 [Trichonephila clavata]|uniref:SAP domain-containing protein n=1 Tax=Trichonephila clavata TaxID=2740835 RepID=A0A8X6FUR9_TRICU|nr:uncharacterized protein TNCT_508051 [Trichonephila clavata]
MDDCFDFFLLEDLETLESIERRSVFIPEHRNNDLDELDEDDFRRRYRFYKGTIETLVELLRTKLVSATGRNHALTAAEKVLAAVRFFAFGNRQINVGDLHSISQPSTSRAITDVARALAELRPQYIDLPQTEDQRMQDFSKSNDIATKLVVCSTHGTKITLTVAQLKMDLRLRKLSTTGNKNDLISRIIEDNIKRNENGTLDELNNLRIQSQNNNETFDETVPDKTDLLNEIEKLRKQVELLRNRSDTSLPSTAQIDPNVISLLNTMMETQKLLLDKHLNTSNVIQITSTNDMANSIEIFKGNAIDNALEWLKEVDRISTLANWSDELKLTNAISRLSGSAKNWQLTTGKNYNDWTTWKTALASRFRRRITMQEFLSHQSERKLRHSETLVDYIYAKDALLEKAPFTIPQPDRISMIIGDITEEKWQIALATQNSITVEELIDRATTLDAI